LATRFPLIVLLVTCALTPIVRAEDSNPRSLDDRLVVEMLAESPDLVTPTGVAVDPRNGLIYVIENNTHHRPPTYTGHPTDRIKCFELRGDGKAHLRGVFHDGFRNGMQLAFHPDGSVYMTTRRSVLRLRDTTGKGVADKIETIIHCDTTAEYPHNGVSGICFTPAGDMYFGIGENAGGAYMMIGTDGVKIEGKATEGGSYYFAHGDGSGLRRIARGIWNPFGMCLTPEGQLFATDNDPGSCPPPRLIHVVEGGDYGYRHHYGGSGTSPLITWTGEFPGTLPMVNAVSEGPSGIICYHQPGLPADYRGKLLLCSWSDHRIEMHALSPRGVSFSSKVSTVVQGGVDFRPVGLCPMPDGSIVFSDWVDASYPVHGKGRLWRLRAKTPDHPPLAPVMITKPQPPRIDPLEMVQSGDPLIVNDGINQLATRGELVTTSTPTKTQRIALLIAHERRDPSAPAEVLRRYLNDDDGDIRFFALRWIADENRTDLRGDIEKLLSRSDLDARTFLGSLQALDRLAGKPVAATPPPLVLHEHLKNPATPAGIKALCLRMIPPTYAKLTVDELVAFSRDADATVRLEAIRSLRDPAALDAIAGDASRSPAERAEALNSLGRDPAGPRQYPGISASDLDGWQKLIEAAPGNAADGARIFFGTKIGTCSRCHVVDGRGMRIGPELTTIGRRATVRFLLESILQPSREIAPQFIPRLVTKKDGTQIVGIPLRMAGTETYLTLDGKETAIKLADIASRQDLTTSLMPPGLMEQMTAQEARDLIAFLMSLK
jgi:hypothetical protein